MTLAADEFMRRFLLHVLPDGFHRIRSYGFLGNRYRHEKLARCQHLLGMTPPPEPSPGDVSALPDYRDRYEALTGVSLWECPVCHQGRILVVELPGGRRGPASAAAGEAPVSPRVHLVLGQTNPAGPCHDVALRSPPSAADHTRCLLSTPPAPMLIAALGRSMPIAYPHRSASAVQSIHFSLTVAASGRSLVYCLVRRAAGLKMICTMRRSA